LIYNNIKIYKKVSWIDLINNIFKIHNLVINLAISSKLILAAIVGLNIKILPLDLIGSSESTITLHETERYILIYINLTFSWQILGRFISISIGLVLAANITISFWSFYKLFITFKLYKFLIYYDFYFIYAFFYLFKMVCLWH